MDTMEERVFDSAPAESRRREPLSPYEPSRFWIKLMSMVKKVSPTIPFSFLGLGIYRAWTLIIMNSAPLCSSNLPVGTQMLLDIVVFITILAIVALSKRIGSLCLRQEVSFGSMCLLVAATLGAFGFQAVGQTVLANLTVAFVGGVGVALMILQWSEVYSALSPTRICVYYAASIAVGQLVGLVYAGFRPEWLPATTAALPLVSYLCLRTCLNRHNAQPRQESAAVSYTFPWKPVLVVALCTLAFCLTDSGGVDMAIPGLSLGTAAGALSVVLLFWVAKDRLGTDLIYGVVLPFTSAAFVLFSTVDEFGLWCGFFARFGNAVSQVFICTMIGAICYHWGANPLWLYGIERVVRTVMQLSGRALSTMAATHAISLTPLVYVLILIATLIILSERRTDAAWGIELSDVQSNPQMTNEVVRKNAIIRRCAVVAADRGLSQREQEVLVCLAQGKTARDIENVLCVANGTVKAHICHVYQKLGIHTREELFAMVGEQTGREPLGGHSRDASA